MCILSRAEKNGNVSCSCSNTHWGWCRWWRFCVGHNNQNFSYIQLGTWYFPCCLHPVSYRKSAQGVNMKELTNWNGHKLEEVVKKAEVWGETEQTLGVSIWCFGIHGKRNNIIKHSEYLCKYFCCIFYFFLQCF